MDLDKLRADLHRDEGRKLKPYVDTKGKVTVGVGRNLTDRGVNDAECDFMLNNDITTAIEDLDAIAPWWRSMTEARQRALCNMAFALGRPRLMGFRRMLHAFAQGDYERAAAECLDSEWAREVGSRAHRIADMIRKGY